MKTNYLFRFLLGCWLLLAVNWVFASGAIPPLEVSKLKSGETTLRVGHLKDFPPFYYLSENPNLQGFSFDVFTQVAKQAGVPKFQFISYNDFDSLSQALLDGKIDLIANDFWDIPRHRQQFLLSDSYFQDGIAALFSAKHNFKTVADLNNSRLGVLASTSDLHIWLKKQPLQHSTIVSYVSPAKLMDDLNQGKIDAAVLPYGIALYTRQNSAQPYKVALLLPINVVFPMRRQDAALQQLMNQAIRAAQQDGMLAKIKSTYFKE